MTRALRNVSFKQLWRLAAESWISFCSNHEVIAIKSDLALSYSC